MTILHKPNFLLIGAFKSGTTAVANLLNEHPDIFMSPVKEPHYFSFAPNPPNFQGPGDSKALSYIILREQNYQKLFSGVTNECIIGEASASYLPHPGTAARIHKILGQPKILVVLRHPADRAYSSYMHLRRDGREPLATFHDALAAEEQRICDNYAYLWRYRSMGYYAQQLKTYFNLFPRQNIHITLYDDLVKNPNSTLSLIFNFLNIDSSISLSKIDQRPNESGLPRNRIIHNLLHGTSPLRSIGRVLIPKPIRSAIRKNNFQRLDCPVDIRNELIHHYNPEVSLLEDLIKRDLSNWKT